jgi:hypothetical protein
MAKRKSDNEGGVPVNTDTRASRHPEGVPVQVPQSSTTTETPPAPKKAAAKKGS